MSLKELAKLAGVSCGYLSDVARGRKCMSPKVQARVEALLEGPAKVEPAPIPSVDCRALWDRMDAHGYSQNEVARLAGISSGHLSQIMNGQRNPSGEVLRKLHGVLFRPSAAELVVPCRGEGDGLEEGRAQRRGGSRRRWTWGWQQPWRRHHSHRRSGALGCRGRSTPTAPGTTAGARCR